MSHISVFPWSPGEVGGAVTSEIPIPSRSSHRNGVMGPMLKATLQRRWKQQVKGDELMTAMSIKQGLKSKFGGRAKQYGAVYYKLYG